MPDTINFTKAALSALPAPARLTYIYDARTPGLALRLNPGGSKAFIVYRKVNGKPERVQLGRFPDMTIEQARKQAAAVLAELASGQSPNDRKRAARAELTLNEAFALYLERHAKPHKRSWREDENQFNRYLTPWKARKLAAIKRTDVQALHTRLGETAGHYAANRVLSLLSSLYNRAADWGYEGGNPAQGVKRYREESRERFVQGDELPRLFQSLADEENTTARDFFLMALLTGARRSNVMAMRWEQLNMERGTWTIPTTKTGGPQTVPLVAEAITILEARRALAEQEAIDQANEEAKRKGLARVEPKVNDWVFPGPGKHGHLVEPKTAWRRILDRAGIEDLRIHDLRRSLGSWQAATGASLSIIGKTLGHRNVSTTAIYARLNTDPVRAAMETATRAMYDAVKAGQPAAPVVAIKGGKA